VQAKGLVFWAWSLLDGTGAFGRCWHRPQGRRGGHGRGKLRRVCIPLGLLRERLKLRAWKCFRTDGKRWCLRNEQSVRASRCRAPQAGVPCFLDRWSGGCWPRQANPLERYHLPGETILGSEYLAHAAFAERSEQEITRMGRDFGVCAHRSILEENP
jgi:hypothetical protein